MTTTTTRDDISELAALAYDAIRPVHSNDKPYAVERVFRESVKAVKESNEFRMNADEAALLVAGRLQKLPDRSDQVFRVSAAKSEHGGHLNERIERYADAFAERLLIKRCEGKPSLLKRRANNFADGFYAATLRLQYQSDEESDEQTTNSDQTTQN
ncbi:type I-D CRISPR-associated protein Cas10d/Csc3 [Haloferax larsenii]|uniref:CRISPR type I-D/CYANO-associated protein Csc3/Cas10d n=1 Tax=Haloferax larsenii TaxID=302484 RepID=A0A1H7UU42_HALLR|nr:type I-D CRISPR-associated protein Cas10d/Csc3 [Haloferax larsenii]SEM00493.1 CRISPR type I-D/CYANO-associated protein Csc3/Cas10d [Haloferax larsenii]